MNSHAFLGIGSAQTGAVFGIVAIELIAAMPRGRYLASLPRPVWLLQTCRTPRLARRLQPSLAPKQAAAVRSSRGSRGQQPCRRTASSRFPVAIARERPLSGARHVDRLLAALAKRNMTVFARIDHAAGAASAGLSLRPTEVVIFGNPKGGTALMQDRSPAIGRHRSAAQGAGLGGRRRQSLAQLQRPGLDRATPRPRHSERRRGGGDGEGAGRDRGRSDDVSLSGAHGTYCRCTRRLLSGRA